MAVYKFEQGRHIYRFDTDTAILLCSRREWYHVVEIFRTKNGRYVQVWKFPHGGGLVHISVIDCEDALRFLALAEDKELTDEGKKLLEEHKPYVDL